MDYMMNETIFQISNKIYRYMVEAGFSPDYAEQFSDQAESMGREYCLQILKEMTVV